jgi:hypothetical protein
VLAAAIIRAMEAASTSETLVKFCQTTRRYNAEDSHLNLELFFTIYELKDCHHNAILMVFHFIHIIRSFAFFVRSILLKINK